MLRQAAVVARPLSRVAYVRCGQPLVMTRSLGSGGHKAEHDNHDAHGHHDHHEDILEKPLKALLPLWYTIDNGMKKMYAPLTGWLAPRAKAALEAAIDKPNKYTNLLSKFYRD